MMNNKSEALFVQGDQFLGLNVNPESGDLVLRFFFIVGDETDGNGRGVTSESIAETRKANLGRPLIYAPNESQGGTKGHTSFTSKNAYDYEIGRIINIEPATKNLLERIRKYSLFQTSSSNQYSNYNSKQNQAFNYQLYNKLLREEKNLWVADFLITNPTAKKIWLNPATTHLIPRYVSPSIIHPRNPTGDYSKVNKWVLDHVGIVDKPIFDMDGRQIAGAAYGERAKLRGACFGDKISCLNVLQTSSSLEKCVSCPTQLKDRLSQLFHDTMKKHSYLFQTSSSNSNSMSTNDSTQQQQGQTTATKPANPLGQLANTFNSQPQTTFTGNDQEQTFTISGFVPDTKALTDYNEFGKYVSQWILENKNEVRTILDSERGLPNSEGQQQQNQQQQQQQTGQETQSPEQVSNLDVKALMEKLNITEDQLKKMETKEVASKFNEIKGVLDTVIKESDRNARAIAEIKKKEEIQLIENMIPKETFTDQRGFNKKDYDELVGYIHSLKDVKGQPLKKDIIMILGVGLIAMRNKQMELSNQQKDLKGNKVPDLFGQSLKQQTIETPNPATV